jgi:hypothetical protein
MLNAIMLSSIMLSAIMLNAFMLNAIMLNAIMLNAIMLNAIMLNAIMLNVIMLNAIMLNAIYIKCQCGECRYAECRGVFFLPMLQLDVNIFSSAFILSLNKLVRLSLNQNIISLVYYFHLRRRAVGTRKLHLDLALLANIRLG